MDALRIKINDRVNDYCPACETPDIQLIETGRGGTGDGRTHEIKYKMVCAHAEVCRKRYEYLYGEVVE